MADTSRKKPWYEMGLGLRQSSMNLKSSTYLLLRFLPGPLGVEPCVRWINNLRTSYMTDTIATFDSVVASLDEGSVVLDCGANVGNVTAELAKTGAQVHCFEPELGLFRLLQKRFSDATNVTIYNAALAARAGVATLRVQQDVHRDSTDFDGHSIVDGWGTTSDEQRVQVDCIDFFDFVAGLKKKPDLIKMDIEGAEVEILERLIAEDRFAEIGPMFVELHERQIPALRARTVKLFRRINSRKGVEVNLLWP